MQVKLLKDIVSGIAGKPASDIVDLIFGKKDVNEFLIAKKLGLTINQIRNILYKLSNYGLVSSIRKKDKRKGWYIYYWTLSSEKSLEFLKKTMNKEIENTENQIKARQSKRFYLCKVCNIEVTEEKALENSFACAECGEVYELNSAVKIIKELNTKLNSLKRNLIVIDEELGKIREKQEKKAKRKREKQEKEKIKKRKKAREKAVKKVRKKIKKKVVKKKAKKQKRKKRKK